MSLNDKPQLGATAFPKMQLWRSLAAFLITLCFFAGFTVSLSASAFSVVIPVSMPNLLVAHRSTTYPLAPSSGATEPVELALISLFPAIAQPGELSFITIRVTNNTDFPLADLTANLGIASTRFVARSGVHEWLDAPINGTLNLINEQAIPEIFPGNSIELGFQIHPEQVPGLNDQRGPRAMALFITDAEGEVLAQVNSYYLWDPGSNANPVSISFIAPITGVMPPGNLEDYAAELPILIAKEERFLAVIESAQAAVAASGNPSAFTLAVDQALASLAAALITAEGPNWLNVLEQAGDAGIPIHALPPYDPDLAALAHAGLSDYEIALLLNPTLPSHFDPPDHWRTPIAWPVDGLTPDRATISTAAPHFEVFLNPAGAGAQWGTITGLDYYQSTSGDLSILINDERLASSFASATSQDHSRGLSLAQELQLFLADIVVISEQNPSDPPHVLVALPRDWHPNINATSIAFNTLVRSGWSVILSINSLLNQSVPDAERTPWPNTQAHPGELSPVEVREIASTLLGIQKSISAALEPARIAGIAEPALLLPLSVAWREFYLTGRNILGPEDLTLSELRSAAVIDAVVLAQNAAGNIEISGTGLTMISDSGMVPLNIHNNLPSDTLVKVALRTEDSRLLVEDEPLVFIPEGVTQLVYVPVRAIASGDVLVSVELQTETGVVVATSEEITLRIRAGWETISTGIVAALVVLMFCAGVFRTVRRGRAATRTSAAAVGDPQIFDSYPLK